jgi:hypothetical protein
MLAPTPIQDIRHHPHPMETPPLQLRYNISSSPITPKTPNAPLFSRYSKSHALPLTPASSRTSPAPPPSTTLAPWLTPDKVQLLHASTHFPWGLSHTGRSSPTNATPPPFPGSKAVFSSPVARIKDGLGISCRETYKEAKTTAALSQGEVSRDPVSSHRCRFSSFDPFDPGN